MLRGRVSVLLATAYCCGGGNTFKNYKLLLSKRKSNLQSLFQFVQGNVKQYLEHSHAAVPQ
jgi:hypothetical protein